jgi:uncharacterized protein involved in response to NO
MENNIEQKLHTINHYLYYPDKKNIPPYLPYGFHPVFLLLTLYIIISMILWGLVYGGIINISFMNDTLTWHIYEMLFGILTAGIMVFLTTGLPKLFPSMVPFIGKQFWWIMVLWIVGRVSFWLIDITGIWLTAILNLTILGWLIWFAKDMILDKLQKHASLGYVLVTIFGLEVWFFASKLGYAKTSSMEILKVTLGFIVILILLAMRRVNMVVVNKLIEDKGIDDIYIAQPPLTNLAVFSVIIFTIVEFIYPTNTALGWIGLACGASILAITGDYILKDKNILNQPYIWYLAPIFFMFASGYALMGWDILNDNIYGINHFRHFITGGGLGLTYLMIMIITGWIHTGRQLTSNIYTHLMVSFIIIATLLRGLIPFYEEFASELYLWSAIIWTLPFILYIKLFSSFLVRPKVYEIKG